MKNMVSLWFVGGFLPLWGQQAVQFLKNHSELISHGRNSLSAYRNQCWKSEHFTKLNCNCVKTKTVKNGEWEQKSQTFCDPVKLWMSVLMERTTSGPNRKKFSTKPSYLKTISVYFVNVKTIWSIFSKASSIVILTECKNTEWKCLYKWD